MPDPTLDRALTPPHYSPGGGYGQAEPYATDIEGDPARRFSGRNQANTPPADRTGSALKGSITVKCGVYY